MIAKTTLPDADRIIKKLGLEKGGRVQKYIDSEVLRLSDPYQPFQHPGGLKAAGQTGTKIGSGEVIWDSPYGKYLYYGKLMVSPRTGSSWARHSEKKVVTDRDLTYNGAPQRGKLWVERMKNDHMSQIVAGVRKMVTGK